MDVTDILRDRMQEPSGFQRMVTLSIGVHVALAAIVIFAPSSLTGRRDNLREVMTISLGGGGEGPRTGGFTSIGGRAIQEVTPPDEPPKREAARPPAAKPPDMTLPTKASAKSAARPEVKQAPDEARGRTPTKGAQITPGSSLAETGARGQGFGLSTGGGPGAGSTLDVADFCCPEYVATMVERIRSVWFSRQGATGTAVVKFTIERDGKASSYTISRSSGSDVLDLAALRAVAQARLPPLPAQFSNPTLGVNLYFEYK